MALTLTPMLTPFDIDLKVTPNERTAHAFIVWGHGLDETGATARQLSARIPTSTISRRQSSHSCRVPPPLSSALDTSLCILTCSATFLRVFRVKRVPKDVGTEEKHELVRVLYRYQVAFDTEWSVGLW